MQPMEVSHGHTLIGIVGAAIGLALSAAAFVFWLWMLIDCLKYETDNTQKIIWALVIFFIPCVGSIVYFFVRKQTRGKSS